MENMTVWYTIVLRICMVLPMAALCGAEKKRLIKLRIGNPTNRGLLVVTIDPIKNSIINKIQYVPPKGTGYFAGSTDITVDATQLIGLRITDLPTDARPAAITAEINKMVTYLKEQRLTIIKISKTDPGLTKAYVTLAITNGVPTLNPNPKIQGINQHPEITFALVKQAIVSDAERKAIAAIRVCPRFGTCDTDGPEKRSALGSSIRLV